MVRRGGWGRKRVKRGIQFERRKGRGATPCHSTLIPNPKTDPIIIISTSRKLTHLFLGGLLLLSLDAGTLLALAAVAGLGAGVTETAVSSLLTLGEGVTADLGDGGLESSVDDGEGSADLLGDTLTGLGGLDVLSGRVELLELTALAGEEDQAGLVVLQAGDVLNLGLQGVVGAAVVDRDTDGGSELLGDTGLLNSGEKESGEPYVFLRFHLRVGGGGDR